MILDIMTNHIKFNIVKPLIHKRCTAKFERCTLMVITQSCTLQIANRENDLWKKTYKTELDDVRYC